MPPASNSTDETTRRPLINRETVVPLGIVIAVIGVATLSAWNVSGALTETDANSQHRFEKLEGRMDAMAASIDGINHDRFTRAEMTMWVELLEARNPTLKIPPIRNE